MPRHQTQQETDELFEALLNGQEAPSFGEFYGYPLCCQWGMHFRMAAVSAGRKPADVDESTLWMGTGYVPCSICAKRPVVDVYRDIMSARICYYPFPFGEYTDLNANIEDGYQERIKVDVALLEHLESHGVELEPMQLKYLADHRAVNSDSQS